MIKKNLLDKIGYSNSGRFTDKTKKLNNDIGEKLNEITKIKGSLLSGFIKTEEYDDIRFSCSKFIKAVLVLRDIKTKEDLEIIFDIFKSLSLIRGGNTEKKHLSFAEFLVNSKKDGIQRFGKETFKLSYIQWRSLIKKISFLVKEKKIIKIEYYLKMSENFCNEIDKKGNNKYCDKNLMKKHYFDEIINKEDVIEGTEKDLEDVF